MDKEKKFNKLFIASIVIAAIITYVSIVLGNNVNKIYFCVNIISLVLLMFGLAARNKAIFYKDLQKIKENYSNGNNRVRKFEDIKLLFDVLKYKEPEELYIDDQTYLDLNMDSVFEKVDRTLSSPGEQYLYYILRNPILKEEKLINRNKIITFFQDNKEIREKIQRKFLKLGRQNINTITCFLWDEISYKTLMKPLLYLLRILAYGSLISITFIGIGKAWIFILIIFAVNGYLSAKIKKDIGGDLASMGYLSKIIRLAEAIGSVEDKELKRYTLKLKEQSKKCKAITRKDAFIKIGRIEGVDMLYEYINIFFLSEARGFNKIIDEVKAHIEDIRSIYLILGEIDALISVASYRDGLLEYVEPKLTKGLKEIMVKDIKHPLIDTAVGNSLTLEKVVIITGSNMSGKSTFLRALGINALFSQTIFTCLATSYEGGYFNIISSMTVTDNVTSGKSYYLSEAEALFRIINGCNEEVTSLCLIDEIFRGTNPIERVNASAEILAYLSTHNSLVAVATHDLEIATMVGDLYECHYFTENVGEHGLEFDYQIRKGVSSTRNAIKVLEFIGYPQEIIYRTNERIIKQCTL
ncbi:MutS-related protein [Clostridium estertheticum]|uniref:MutS-related protein n=1 Tax=Clostridium estertheticum TaxID=238834 RepID=UPI001C7D9ED9|nr:MutS family DNA mismatch repair protein [Clostridium estertheticum]MBX4265450.1 MutS family DNA mismatch repair protein [Clostridium estertheticum]WLC90198.1 MutS family DNA mismatch repair protein [Clostridium estertheticum]